MLPYCHSRAAFLVASPEGRIAMVAITQKTVGGFDSGGKMCPILENPQPNCYCFDMTSMKIPYAVKYCLRDFKACKIFQKAFKKDQKLLGP